MREISAAAVAACVLCAAGCGDYAAERADVAEVEISDSAGVRTVDLGSDLRRLTMPRAGLERSFTVGQPGSGLDLFRVSSARFLPSGELAIGNSGVPEVVVVDPDGALVRRIGDRGEGPGQFGTVTSLHVGEGGSIVAFDDRQGRLTRFEVGGEVVATRRMAEPNNVADLIPLVASQDGPALAVYGDNRIFGGDGIRRDSTPLFRFTPESTRPDTLATWGTKAWRFASVGRGRTRSPLAFGPDLLRGGRGDRAALADTHTPQVHVYGASGEMLMLFRWDEPMRPVTDAEYEAWREDRRDELSEELPEELRERMLAVPPFETHPVIHGVLVDAEGGVWIAPSVLREGGETVWLVLGPQGEPRGSVRVPDSAVLLDAADGRLAVLERSELDVEVVTVYRVGREA